MVSPFSNRPFPILRPVVTTSAALSLAGSTLLCVLCARTFITERTLLVGREAASARLSVRFILAWLAVADFIFAGGFLLAQLPTGDTNPLPWNNTTNATRGALCYATAAMNEIGGTASSFWTATLAYVLFRSLTLRRTSFWRMRWRVLVGAWLSIFAFESILFLGFYWPKGMLGPGSEVPWCHWKAGYDYFGFVLYSITFSTCIFCVVLYTRIILFFRSATSQHLALIAHPAGGSPSALRIGGSTSTTEEVGGREPEAGSRGNSTDPVPPPTSRLRTAAEEQLVAPTSDAALASHARSTMRSLDRRLLSYLSVYLVCQIPGLVHRAWQGATASDAPPWLGVVQTAMQPAQGFLNACVFAHHGLACRGERRERSCRECCVSAC
jgi:hypothetical protein